MCSGDKEISALHHSSLTIDVATFSNTLTTAVSAMARFIYMLTQLSVAMHGYKLHEYTVNAKVRHDIICKRAIVIGCFEERSVFKPV